MLGCACCVKGGMFSQPTARKHPNEQQSTRVNVQPLLPKRLPPGGVANPSPEELHIPTLSGVGELGEIYMHCAMAKDCASIPFQCGWTHVVLGNILVSHSSATVL